MYTVWYSFRDSFTSFIIHMTVISFSCFIALLRTPSGRRQWQPTPVLLHGGSHGRRTLVGCSPWGCKESDMTERLHFHFSLSCIGEGNGNPLQCSCLENPRDGGAWWAAVYRVAQSWTRLKRLSRSSSRTPSKLLARSGESTRSCLIPSLTEFPWNLLTELVARGKRFLEDSQGKSITPIH